MRKHREYWTNNDTTSRGVMFAMTLLTGGGMIVVCNQRTGLEEGKSTTGEESEAVVDELSSKIKILSADFMDKLASKPYMHDHGKVVKEEQQRRPSRVPQSLRLVTIDAPQITQYVKDSRCIVAADKVYPDGVASPKQIQFYSRKTKRNIDLDIEQKALIRNMVQCYHHGQIDKEPGIEIMQASIQNLNPDRLERNHPVRTLRNYMTSRKEDTKQHELTIENELHAPWHQHAWISELKLRISGQVAFGETNLVTSKTSKQKWWRYTEHNNYLQFFQSQIPKTRTSWWFWSKNDGHDGWNKECKSSRAGNKPHAVIANGQALSYVPNSFRILQKICHDANVPLYIWNDPRSYAVSKDDELLTLPEILQEMRKNVKRRIITDQLETGSSFQRGRWFGILETEAAWRAKEVIRISKAAVQKAQQNQKDYQWQSLDEVELREQLIKRGVLINANEFYDSPIQCTKAFRSIAKQCMEKSATASSNPNNVDDHDYNTTTKKR